MTTQLIAYEFSGLRWENRGAVPPAKETIDDIIRGARETGIGALWNSGVDHLGRPLFPSRVFPNCHPAANREAFTYLTSAAHEIGRPILSWYPLNMCKAIIEEHPDWRMQFYDVPGVEPNDEWAQNYCCPNSPYGELLPQFAVELIDLGFDGIWFDGSTMSNHNTWPSFAPGCVCHYCRERFQRETGLALPEKYDFDNRTFRMWINWRYDVLMECWQRIVTAVTARRADATVCFNNYRRRHLLAFGWPSAIPLRKLPLDCVMSSELDHFPHQADFQIKMHRAYGCARTPETWWPLHDHFFNGPDVEALPGIQAALGAIGAGGMLSTGTSLASEVVREPLAQVQRATERYLPYIQGDTIEYAAILCSQHTQDFAGKQAPNPWWDEWHGANEICRQGHVQSSIIFDDDVTPAQLAHYPLLILGNTMCLSTRQAAALTEYVSNGGTLIACSQVGAFDELGYPHPRPVLDELLGIKSRRAGKGEPTFDLRDDSLKTETGNRWVTLHPWCWIDPAQVQTFCALAEPEVDVELLADVLDVPYRTRSKHWEHDWYETWQETPQPEPRFPGLWLRRVGRGKIVYSCVDIFRAYLYSPTPHGLRFVMALLRKLATPALELQGPLCVTMNSRKWLDGRTAVLLHNCPGTAHRYPNPPRAYHLHTPLEVLPVHDLEIISNGRKVRSAFSVNSEQYYQVSNDGRHVEVPRLDLFEVVLLDWEE